MHLKITFQLHKIFCFPCFLFHLLLFPLLPCPFSLPLILHDSLPLCTHYTVPLTPRISGVAYDLSPVVAFLLSCGDDNMVAVEATPSLLVKGVIKG